MALYITEAIARERHAELLREAASRRLQAEAGSGRSAKRSLLDRFRNRRQDCNPECC